MVEARGREPESGYGTGMRLTGQAGVSNIGGVVSKAWVDAEPASEGPDPEFARSIEALVAAVRAFAKADPAGFAQLPVTEEQLDRLYRDCQRPEYLRALEQVLSHAHDVMSGEAVTIDWVARATAISRPAAYWVLSYLNEHSAIDFERLEQEFEGAEDWIALGELMRAGYVFVGKRMIHLTWRGREAFEEFSKRHPELSALA
jgi:hypothetical protein